MVRFFFGFIYVEEMLAVTNRINDSSGEYSANRPLATVGSVGSWIQAEKGHAIGYGRSGGG